MRLVEAEEGPKETEALTLEQELVVPELPAIVVLLVQMEAVLAGKAAMAALLAVLAGKVTVQAARELLTGPLRGV